jgi:tRNA threonylcarbamoyl adenosine modification protein YjeE
VDRFSDSALDEAALTASAERLGRLLRPGDVLLLEGPMGAGKTTFVRALARGMGVDRPQQVRSPSFTLCMIHEGPVTLMHVDLFRLGETDESDQPVGAAAFEALGLEELAEQQDAGSPSERGPAVLVVEWADFWTDPPPDYLRVRIERPAGACDERSLEITPSGARARELAREWL